MPLPFKLEGIRKSNLIPVICHRKVLNKDKEGGDKREDEETRGTHRKTTKDVLQSKGLKFVEVSSNLSSIATWVLVCLVAVSSFHFLNLVSVGTHCFGLSTSSTKGKK